MTHREEVRWAIQHKEEMCTTELIIRPREWIISYLDSMGKKINMDEDPSLE